jgi:hypothetical protein
MRNLSKTQQKHAQAAIKLIAISMVAVLASCASPPAPQQAPAPAPAPVAKAPVPAPVPAPIAKAPVPSVASLPQVANITEYRRRAAKLIMEANAASVAKGALPEQLYGIPVVQVQLNADGSIKNLDFMRQSKVGPETNNLALQAIRRVGNFGPIGNLPQPWQFNETFLYNDSMKFQLRTIVERL